MSIISISFDTQKKTLYVSINGQKIDDVRNVYISRYYEDEAPHIELTTSKENKEDGVVVENRVYASNVQKVSRKDCEIVDIEKYEPKIFRY
jgi:hypothetical protein